MSNDKFVEGGIIPANETTNSQELLEYKLLPPEAPDIEGYSQILFNPPEKPRTKAAELGNLVIGHVVSGVKTGARLFGAISMDIHKPEEKPLATRTFILGGVLVEAATLSKVASIWSLPLAFSEAGADPSLAKIGLATATLTAVTPAWVWFSSRVISEGTMKAKRSQDVLRSTPLPAFARKVIPKDNLEQQGDNDNESTLDKARHLGKAALKQSLAAFFVVTPQVYNAIFENKSPEEIKKLCNDMTKWSALGAAAVTASATGIVGGLHEVAPGPASFVAHEMGNSFVYMGLMFSKDGIGQIIKGAWQLASKATSKLTRRKPTIERHLLEEGDAYCHENHELSLTNTPILGIEAA